MIGALWPERWPAIALQECIDEVAAAPATEQQDVRMGLPCKDCPENARCLTAKRKEIGSLLYDRELLSNPRSSESSLFPRELFEPCILHDREQLPLWRKPFGLEHRFAVVQAWDIAWSEKVGGDYLVCMTGFLDRDVGIRQILEIQRWQRVSFDDQIQLIESKWRDFEADGVVIEADAAQQVWHQHLRNSRSQVPVMTHNASQKKDFRHGVPSLIIKLENGRYRFPYAPNSHRREEMSNFFNEAEAFGWVDGKLEGVGEHDDTIMAWWHLDWGLDRMTMATGRGDRGLGRGENI